MVTLGLMLPRAWHSGFRETVEDVDPSLHPSDLDGIDDEFDLFSQSPEDPSPSRTIQEEPNTAFSNSSTNGVWRCLMCDSTSSYAVGRDWKCADCGHGSFYRGDRPTKQITDAGTWMFVPHVDSPSSTSSRRRRRRRGYPSGSDSPDGSEERAESEVPTRDPTVDPDAPQNQVTQPNLPQPNVSGQQDLLRALRQLVTEKDDSDRADWNSAKGPRPGIKWKGGTAPCFLCP